MGHFTTADNEKVKNNKANLFFIWVGILVVIYLTAMLVMRYVPFEPSVPLAPSIKNMFHVFEFNHKNDLNEWEEKIFHGHVNYWIDFKGPGGFVHSESTKTASAIFFRIKFDIARYPHLLWKWRVGKFPDKSKTTDPQKQDDFAARVYVIFSQGFFTNFRCVEYVWDESIPEGTIINSPYSDKIKQLVLRSGRLQKEEWAAEHRNVFEDYRKLFGELPKMKVAAIALMTDAEGTESEAEGFFDDILIGKI